MVCKTEDYWRSHQVPMAEMATNPGHIKLLEAWMKSYKPEELFDANGTLKPDLPSLAPTGTSPMGANPHANGGLLLRGPQRCRSFETMPSRCPSPGP